MGAAQRWVVGRYVALSSIFQIVAIVLFVADQTGPAPHRLGWAFLVLMEIGTVIWVTGSRAGGRRVGILAVAGMALSPIEALAAVRALTWLGERYQGVAMLLGGVVIAVYWGNQEWRRRHGHDRPMKEPRASVQAWAPQEPLTRLEFNIASATALGVAALVWWAAGGRFHSPNLWTLPGAAITVALYLAVLAVFRNRDREGFMDLDGRERERWERLPARERRKEWGWTIAILISVWCLLSSIMANIFIGAFVAAFVLVNRIPPVAEFIGWARPRPAADAANPEPGSGAAPIA